MSAWEGKPLAWELEPDVHWVMKLPLGYTKTLKCRICFFGLKKADLVVDLGFRTGGWWKVAELAHLQ